MKLVNGRTIAASLLVALVAGCATQQQQQSRYAPVPSVGSADHLPRVQYGQVQSIDATRAGGRQASGGGAVVGGVVGALLGHQVSRGGEKAAATAIGAIGGALLGNEIEKQQSRGGTSDAWRVSIRLDNGAQRSFDYAQLNDLRVGDRVRIVDNQVYRD